MLVTAKKEVEAENKLPARASYYSLIDETDREKDSKVINYDEFLDLKTESETSENISFETLNPDLLPSEATLRVLRGGTVRKEESRSVQKPKARAKGKAMVAVYAAAVITLLLVVILNAVALVRLTVSTDNLQEEVGRAQASVEQMNEYAASLSDEQWIIDRAEDLGFAK